MDFFDFLCESDPRLSRPEIWFDCSFSTLLYELGVAAVRGRVASGRAALGLEAGDLRGAAVATGRSPPLPPVVLVVWRVLGGVALVALAGAARVAGRQQVADGGVVAAITTSQDPELSRPEIWLDCSFSRLLSE